MSKKSGGIIKSALFTVPIGATLIAFPIIALWLPSRR